MGDFCIITISFVAVSIFILFLNIFIYFFLLSKAGGFITLMVLSRYGGVTAYDNILQIIPQLSIYTFGAGILMTVPGSIYRRFFLIAEVLSCLIMMNYGDRSAIVMPFIVLIIARHFAVRRIALRKLVPFFLVLVLVLSLLGQIRTTLGNQSRIGSTGGSQPSTLETLQTDIGVARGISLGLNLGTFDTFLVILRDFSFAELKYGEDFINGVLAFIPRVIWKEKPEFISPGNWFKSKYFGDGRTGLPLTVLGEWWVNFGLIGVLIGMFLSGLVLKALWYYMNVNRSVFGAYFYALLMMTVFIQGIVTIWAVLIIKSAFILYIVYYVTSGNTRLHKTSLQSMSPAACLNTS